MASESSNRGGRRYKHPDAGRVVRAIFEKMKVLEENPKQTAMIAAGLLLSYNSSSVQLSGPYGDDTLFVEKIEVTDPTGMMYTVMLNEDLVFEALVTKDEVTYGKFTDGEWLPYLEQASEMARQTFSPRPIKATPKPRRKVR